MFLGFASVSSRLFNFLVWFGDYRPPELACLEMYSYNCAFSSFLYTLIKSLFPFHIYPFQILSFISLSFHFSSIVYNLISAKLIHPLSSLLQFGARSNIRPYALCFNSSVFEKRFWLGVMCLCTTIPTISFGYLLLAKGSNVGSITIVLE